MIHLDFPNIDDLKNLHYKAVESYVYEVMDEAFRVELYGKIRQLFPDLNSKYNPGDRTWLERFILADVDTLELWASSFRSLLKFKEFLELYKSRFATTDKYVDKAESYNAYTLIKEMDLHVCPYCEDEYFDVLDTAKGERRTNDYDHFYPKGEKNEFPALAMCFFNLVPSCKVCNFIMKTTSVAANPYHPDIESWSTFESNVPIGSNYESLPLSAFTVTLKCRGRMVSNESVLAINQRYNNRNKEIHDILINFDLYSDAKISELKRIGIDDKWLMAA